MGIIKISLNDFDGQLLDGLEFCAKAYSLFEQLRVLPGGVERLRDRSGEVEKLLQGEIFPICRYVQNFYCAGRYISVRWVNGSQSFDAEVHQRGSSVSLGYFPERAHLEATCAMHENEHWTWKLLNQDGFSYAPEGVVTERGKPVMSLPVVFDHTEHVTGFVPIVVDRIRKKSEIAYPDETSLIVKCELSTLYTASDWQLLVSLVEKSLQETPFREILLLDIVMHRLSPLAVRTKQ